MSRADFDQSCLIRVADAPLPPRMWSIPALCRACWFATWAVVISTMVSSLMASHSVQLPSAVVTANGNLPRDSTTIARRWHAIHILAEGCPCSQAVARYLIGRGAAANLEETVMIPGSGDSELVEQLRLRGFEVSRVTAEQLLAGLGVRGGPWLVLKDPNGTVRYSGGYAAERPRSVADFQDLSILSRLKVNEIVQAYPAFGCAIDPQLKHELDPLGIQYR